VADIMHGLVRVLVEVLLIQTATLFLRTFGVGVVPSDSIAPWRQKNGKLVIQEWVAVVLGLILWLVGGAIVVGLLR
jgi:hypothetical protein